MSKQVFLGRVARPFVAVVERYYPDPFVFLIVLTSLAFVLALALTPASPDAALQAWGDGLAGLLSFMAQIALTLLTAHALAHTDPVVRGLHKLARVPSSVRGCYAMVALIAGALSAVGGCRVLGHCGLAHGLQWQCATVRCHPWARDVGLDRSVADQ